MNSRSTSGAALLALALAAPAVATAAGPSQVQAGAEAGHRITARAPKKPNGSGIDVQFSVDATVKPGQPATVVIQFDGVTDPAGATVRFAADAGLEVSPPDPVRLPRGESTTVTLQATPAGEGVVYLNVFTTQNGATAVTSIPVQGGTATPALRPSGGVLKKTPAGESVISMPAR